MKEPFQNSGHESAIKYIYIIVMGSVNTTTSIPLFFRNLLPCQSKEGAGEDATGCNGESRWKMLIYNHYIFSPLFFPINFDEVVSHIFTHIAEGCNNTFHRIKMG